MNAKKKISFVILNAVAVAGAYSSGYAGGRNHMAFSKAVIACLFTILLIFPLITLSFTWTFK